MSYISNMKEVMLQHYEKTREVDGSVKYLWVDNIKIYISLYLTSTTKNITDVVYNDSDYVGLTFDDTVNKDNKDNYRIVDKDNIYTFQKVTGRVKKSYLLKRIDI